MIDRFQLLYDNEDVFGVSKVILSTNSNLTTEQIDLLYKTRDEDIMENLGRYSKLTEEQFMRFYNEADFLDLKFLSRNPHLTTEQIDLLYETEGASKNKLAQWPKLTEEQFMRFFKDKDVKKPLLAYNSNLTTEQIDFLYDYANNYVGRLNPNDDIKRLLVQKSKLTDEQFTRFFNDKDLPNRNLAKNPHLTPEQIDLLYKGEDMKTNENLARYSKLTEEQFMRFFNKVEDSRFGLQDVNKLYLSANPNLTPEQIDLLYNTEEVEKHYLARFPKLTDEQFMRFLDDRDLQRQVREYLAQNPSINPTPSQTFASGIFNWKW